MHICVVHSSCMYVYMCVCIPVHCGMSSLSMEQLEHCIEAACLVRLAVKKKVTGDSKNERKLMRSSIALTLYLLGKLNNFQSSQKTSIANQAGEMRTHGLKQINRFLSWWLQCGRHTHDDNDSVILACTKEELKVTCTYISIHKCMHMHAHFAHTNSHCTICMTFLYQPCMNSLVIHAIFFYTCVLY